VNILIVGGGGREHAMAWKISQNPKVKQLYVAPGNPGCAQVYNTQNISIQADDIAALIQFAKTNNIDVTLVGPELPLSKGIVDAFQKEGLAIFGPSQKAAQLESSKAFSKAFMQRHHIPTAHFATFHDSHAAKAHIQKMGAPIVLKLDGLAAGKGVIVAMTLDEALSGVDCLFEMGGAQCELIVEQCLEGEELSFIVIADGEHAFALPTSQDHKRLKDGDQGPNTGGMGVYAPSRLMTEHLHDTVMQSVIAPTLKGMQQEGMPFVGFLYAGLMISQTGEMWVLEFNARLGDPETEVILPIMQDDLLDLVLLALDKKLPEAKAKLSAAAAIGVVMANDTYPEGKASNDVIQFPQAIPENQFIFHAGTRQIEGGDILASGGRVLCATALGQNFGEAKAKAYDLIKKIHWDHAYYRTDIAWRVIEKQ